MLLKIKLEAFLLIVLALHCYFGESEECSASEPCPNNYCCSKWGFCGDSDLHCGDGCLSNCKGSKPGPTTAAPILPGGVCSTSSSSTLITKDQFKKAITSNGYPTPNDEQYTNLVNQAKSKGDISTKRELAMFLAQILWESDGLRAKKEYACIATGCPGQYTTGIGYPGQNYFGRGYIQLSWDYNYKSASYDLFGDDRLLKNPEQVAANDAIAWGTAFWYWKKHVHSAPGVQNGQFGSTTKAINGALECQGFNTDKARKRFEIYKKCLLAFNCSDRPIEAGCY